MAELAHYVRRVVLLVDTTTDAALLAELRLRHRMRLERRLGPADRRQQPRELVRPLWGTAYAYGGRRATDRPPAD